MVFGYSRNWKHQARFSGIALDLHTVESSFHTQTTAVANGNNSALIKPL